MQKYTYRKDARDLEVNESLNTWKADGSPGQINFQLLESQISWVIENKEIYCFDVLKNLLILFSPSLTIFFLEKKKKSRKKGKDLSSHVVHDRWGPLSSNLLLSFWNLIEFPSIIFMKNNLVQGWTQNKIKIMISY